MLINNEFQLWFSMESYTFENKNQKTENGTKMKLKKKILEWLI